MDENPYQAPSGSSSPPKPSRASSPVAVALVMLVVGYCLIAGTVLMVAGLIEVLRIDIGGILHLIVAAFGISWLMRNTRKRHA